MAHKQRIDVGGYHLSMECVGAGSPTVIFESGMGCGAESLANLAAEVQHSTRTVLYDRAGLGQSDPAPTPRTSQEVVDDLWRLLQQAQIDGLYLLVGHSFAGLHLRLFAHQQPKAIIPSRIASRSWLLRSFASLCGRSISVSISLPDRHHLSGAHKVKAS